MIYKPREDSFLLQKHIAEYAAGNVLEIGTGSGILAIDAARQKSVKNIVAVDINEEELAAAKENAEKQEIKKIVFIKSDLFGKVNGKFNLIIFNPPYLPSKKIEDIAVDGGKNGTEVVEKFLASAGKHLEKKGKILILASSLNKNIEQMFRKYKYAFAKIDEQKFFMEQLFVYVLEQK